MTEQGKKVFHNRKTLNLKVKQDLQVWLLIRIMATAVLTILVASCFLYVYALTVVDAEFLSHAPKVRRVSEVLLPILVAASLTSIVVGLLMALFLPQKIAGPIFRIEQDLQLIRAGNLNKVITLRCGDILTELAQAVNLTIRDFRNMINDIKKTNIDLETTIEKGDIAEVRAALEKQKKYLEQIST